jgi:O-phosphoseryl-tRNA(Cys) synthetase
LLEKETNGAERDNLRLLLAEEREKLRKAELDLSFQEVVHPVRTEEAEVAEASCMSRRTG